MTTIAHPRDDRPPITRLLLARTTFLPHQCPSAPSLEPAVSRPARGAWGPSAKIHHRRRTFSCAALPPSVPPPPSSLPRAAVARPMPQQSGYYVIRWDNTGVCQIWNTELQRAAGALLVRLQGRQQTGADLCGRGSRPGKLRWSPLHALKRAPRSLITKAGQSPGLWLCDTPHDSSASETEAAHHGKRIPAGRLSGADRPSAARSRPTSPR